MGAAPATPRDADLLLLFDIDGTLLQNASRAHAAALHRALAEVHGLHEIDRGRTPALDPAGRTDPEIARQLLLGHDVTAKQIDARAADVRIACGAAYAELCPPDLSETVIPGIPALLEQLAQRSGVRLALVTGNYETVARIKLRAAGIGRWFPSGQGGFGSDGEDRTDLPPIARGRAGAPGGPPHPRERTIVIGDTPRDVACALADDVRCIGVETGRFRASDLPGASAVAADPAALGAILEQLI